MIILIGNKADLEAQRDVTYEEAKQFAEENGEPDTKPQMLEAAREFLAGGSVSLYISSCCYTVSFNFRGSIFYKIRFPVLDYKASLCAV